MALRMVTGFGQSGKVKGKIGVLRIGKIRELFFWKKLGFFKKKSGKNRKNSMILSGNLFFFSKSCPNPG